MTGTTPAGPVVDPGFDEWRRSEGSMLAARWFGVLFAVFQVAVYEAPNTPALVEPTGFALAGLLALATAAGSLTLRRLTTVEAVRRLAWTTLLFDATLISAYVWLYAFDTTSSLYLLFFIIPAEAAMKFQATGALVAWAACTTMYVAREWWGAAMYGHEVQVSSITFRMGILLMVSLIMGLFARKLARRTTDLGEALAALERQERWRQALIDMLAHDLRAPVGAAASTSMLLRDRSDELRPVQVRQLAAAAVRQNERAMRLTQDLLDLARSQQDRLELQPEATALPDLLRRIVEGLVTDGVDIHVTVDEGLRATVDPGRLEQVVANLVSNAVKHGRPPVEVVATAVGPDLELRVTDRGDGVPLPERPSLFRPFSVGTKTGSVGLGLWVVRTLVESHGGTVGYEPVDGQPSFVARLPGAVLPSAASTAPPPVPAS